MTAAVKVVTVIAEPVTAACGWVLAEAAAVVSEAADTTQSAGHMLHQQQQRRGEAYIAAKPAAISLVHPNTCQRNHNSSGRTGKKAAAATLQFGFQVG